MERDLIAEFMDWHTRTKSLAPARQVQQAKVLRGWEGFLDELGVSLLEATGAELEDWVASWGGTYDPHTITNMLYSITPFLHWLWRRRLIDAERWLGFREVSPPRGGQAHNYEPRPYSRVELRQFWADFNRKFPPDPRFEHWLARYHRGQSGWKRVRPGARRIQTEAIIALALGGGLRRVEMFNLPLANLEPQASYLAVIGARKNPEAVNRTRPVPWTSDWMHEAVSNWIDLRTRLAPDHDFPWLTLITGNETKPMSERVFAGLPSRIGRWEWHRLRHTCATELLRTGEYQLHEVQKIMGHTNPAQTLRYTQILPGDIVSAARRASSAYGNVVGPPRREAA